MPFEKCLDVFIIPLNEGRIIQATFLRTKHPGLSPPTTQHEARTIDPRFSKKDVTGPRVFLKTEQVRTSIPCLFSRESSRDGRRTLLRRQSTKVARRQLDSDEEG